MTTERLNTSAYYSRIFRFVDFDISTGISTVMNGGLINNVSLSDGWKLYDLLMYSKGHVKKINENTFVIDRWIYEAIKKGDKL